MEVSVSSSNYELHGDGLYKNSKICVRKYNNIYFMKLNRYRYFSEIDYGALQILLDNRIKYIYIGIDSMIFQGFIHLSRFNIDKFLNGNNLIFTKELSKDKVALFDMATLYLGKEESNSIVLDVYKT